jgi:hypothetical protein
MNFATRRQKPSRLLKLFKKLHLQRAEQNKS